MRRLKTLIITALPLVTCAAAAFNPLTFGTVSAKQLEARRDGGGGGGSGGGSGFGAGSAGAVGHARSRNKGGTGGSGGGGNSTIDSSAGHRLLMGDFVWIVAAGAAVGVAM